MPLIRLNNWKFKLKRTWPGKIRQTTWLLEKSMYSALYATLKSHLDHASLVLAKKTPLNQFKYFKKSLKKIFFQEILIHLFYLETSKLLSFLIRLLLKTAFLLAEGVIAITLRQLV